MKISELFSKRGFKSIQATRLLLLVEIFTFLIFVASLFFSWNSYKDLKKIIHQTNYITKLKGTVLYYDEVLTMSAKMASVTRDLYWEERYNNFKVKLDSTLNKLITVIPEMRAWNSAKKTQIANEKLVKMERQAFEAVKKGRLGDAQSLLTDSAYKKQKEVYTEGMLQVGKDLDEASEKMIYKQKSQLIILIGILCIAIPFLIISWQITYRKFKNLIKNLTTKNQQLVASEQQLKAKNQQLRATEQQLRANNQQLIASEKALKESELKLNAAQHLAKIGYFSWNVISGEVNWSDGMYSLLKYDKNENIDIAIVNSKIHHPDDLDRITIWLNDSLTSGKDKLEPNEYRLIRKDGKVILVHTEGKITYENGKAMSIFGICQDITERKLAEEALRQSEERNRLMLNTTLDGFILADEDGKIMQVNPGYCKMIGYSEQELLSMNIHEIEVLESDQQTKEHIQQLISNGKARFETRHRAKDGHLIDLEVSVSNLKVGEKTLGAAFIRDITERKRAEEELRESEESLKTAQRVAHVGNYKYNLKTDEVNWSDELLRIYGLDPAETGNILSVEDSFKNVHPEDAEQLKLSVGKAVEQGLGISFVYRIIRPEGELRYLFGFIEPEFDKDGNLSHILGTAQDITERKQAEKALKEARSNLQALLDNRKDSIWSLDRNYNYLVFNKPYADIIYSNLGVRLEKGINALEIHPKEVNDFWKPKFDEVFEGKYVSFEFSQVLDEKERFFEVYMNPIYTDNKVSGLSALSMDITDRKQAEKELIKLTTAVTQSPSIIAITDTNGNLEYVNPKFRELTGYSQEELIGHNPRILQSGEHSAEMYKELWETILSGKIWQGEFHNKKKNGELYWERASITPIFDEKGKIINYLKDSEDVTERKQAEEELRKYREHLEELVKERTEELEKSLKDLERMNELFVGREFRIKELREEIVFLKGKLNNLR